jgi:F420H(2)-dependent biliverdin reductase
MPPSIRLVTDTAREFVRERHLAILSTPGRGDRIHSVPVGFTIDDGILRIITSDRTQKVRNIERGGHATVAQVDGVRWISFAGLASIARDTDAVARAVELYAARYRQPRTNPIRVVIEMEIETVLGSAGMT